MRKLNQDNQDQPAPSTREHEATFRNELESLINRYCMENASDTPDFILASYILRSLQALNFAVSEREAWYGRKGKHAFVSSNKPNEPA